jgi:indolepyruvate ferredoxin oxidoreductase beta subunit
MDIVINGVGGQGVVLASRVIAQTALKNGLEVRTSETIGMAQREGSVVSHVRLGKELFGAIIPDKQADILLSFELAETLRGLKKLKSDGYIIANLAKVIPVSVNLGDSSYEYEEILNYLKGNSDRLKLLDAQKLALEAGNYKSVNMVLLGVLSKMNLLPFEGDELLSTALKMLPKRLHEINKKAFLLGKKEGEI